MFSAQIHRYLFQFGSCALLMGMMLGTVPTSVPQFILLGNWLLEGKFQEKWNRIKSDKLFWILSSLFIIHVLGLFYSNNLKAGWDDVRTKIPLMYLPLIYFSSNPLSKKELHYLFIAFLAGTTINLSWCFTYKHILHLSEQIRDVSRFMSHIRLGFLVDMAIFIAVFFLFHEKYKKWMPLLIVLILYYVFSLVSLGLMSGALNLAITGSLFLIFYLWKQNKLYFSLFILILISAIGSSMYLALKFHKEHFQLSDNAINQQQDYSRSKRPFNHYPLTKQIENGILVSNNIQDEELQNEWNRRVPGDSILLHKQQNLQRYFTLIRFISSKHQWKDSLAVAGLSNNEIHQITQGIPNYLYPKWTFIKKRFYELVCEYDEYRNHGNINGHSFTMRLFYLKSAIAVIKTNPLFGVGTGDVQEVINDEYRKSGSPLDEEWYKRPHNQFITITVALGIIGFIVFLISLIFPLIELKQHLHALYYLFFASAIISFLFEDTLETQIGLSFFAVFNTVLLSVASAKKKQILQD